MNSSKKVGTYIEELITHISNEMIRVKDHDLEYIKLGLMSDPEKLRVLKQELYRASISRANTEHISNLKTAINLISQQLENERQFQGSFTYQMYGIFNSIILLSILATGFSFPMAWTCNLINSQSKACQVSRVIPYSLIRFFSEPTTNQ